MRPALLTAALAWCGLSCLPCTADELEVIALEHRLYAEIAPLLEPLLAPGGTLTGNGAQLIVRTTPTNLAEIKQALAALDVRAQRLRIAVSQTRRDDRAYDNASLGISVQGPPPHARSSISAEIASTQGRDEGTSVQSVLTTDGEAAYVNAGQALPTPYYTQSASPWGPVAQEGISYQQTSTGFYVTPHVHGENVTLEISSQRERFANDGSGAVTTDGLSTTVSGRLGGWIALGGVTETVADSRAGVVAHTRRQTQGASGFWVRVDTVD